MNYHEGEDMDTVMGLADAIGQRRAIEENQMDMKLTGPELIALGVSPPTTTSADPGERFEQLDAALKKRPALVTATKLALHWDEISDLVRERWPYGKHVNVFGVPRGGIHIAQILAKEFDCNLVTDPLKAAVVVDDLIDSGATRKRFLEYHPGRQFWAPINKLDGEEWKGRWMVFPWEMSDVEDQDETEIAARLLQTLGVDTSSDGLRDTPGRLLRSLRELTDGYGANLGEILSTSFQADYDEMVIVKDIGFWSLCEHHVLPFHGTITIAYLPKGNVVGLSKLARLARALSRRLQIQERLTAQITAAIDEHLDPLGSACLISATHLCMAMRGVQTPATMVTSSLTRGFRQPEVRAEFLALAK